MRDAARGLVLVLAHERAARFRRRAPVDVARVVAVAELAQAVEVALPPLAPLRLEAGDARARRRGVAELRQLRKDDHLGWQLDEARLAEQRERELRRQAEAGVGVAAAARKGVAIGGVLQPAGGELEEVALLVERLLADEILDLDGERGQAPLAVRQADAHEERPARVDARRAAGASR